MYKENICLSWPKLRFNSLFYIQTSGKCKLFSQLHLQKIKAFSRLNRACGGLFQGAEGVLPLRWPRHHLRVYSSVIHTMVCTPLYTIKLLFFLSLFFEISRFPNPQLTHCLLRPWRVGTSKSVVLHLRNLIYHTVHFVYSKSSEINVSS